MRARGLILGVVVVAALHAPTVPVGAQDLTDIADACHEAGGDARQCRGLEHFFHTLGVLCRDAITNDPSCASVDGTVISRDDVDRHEQSWLARALALQRGLDDDNPLQEELWTHTHNSYNADAYPPTFYGTDRNHIYTITDQLKMGIRAIEIDLHWAHSASGTPETGGKAVVVCHGAQVPAQATTVHFGCGVNDPSLDARLEEVRDWLEPKNPGEVVMLYLENQLEDSEAAHNLAAQSIQRILGPLVYKPSERCAPLPFATSRRQIRDTGARVIITGNCGPGGWGNWVHKRGTPSEVHASQSRWLEGGLDHGDDYPAFHADPALDECAKRRASQRYDRNWIRHWGDETGLSNGAGEGGDVTLADARNMVRCGVNMIGLDNLVPFDKRLEQLVWSWARNEPRSGGCAYQGADGRFRSDDCNTRRPFACFNGAAWTTTLPGPWQAGAGVCRSQSSSFAVPRTGYDNELLKQAKPTGTREVWLAYRNVGGAWVAGS